MIYTSAANLPNFPQFPLYRKNKILCTLNSSQDGRNLDSIWIDYDPNDRFALYLLKKCLDFKTMQIYDSEGNRTETIFKDN